MDKVLQDAFGTLRQKLGSHSTAAQTLGINRDHYCAMRNGRVKIPQRTADYIILKASELEPSPSPSPTPPAEAGAEARA